MLPVPPGNSDVHRLLHPSAQQMRRPAALLQIPYLLWISFAAYLNWGVWMLNR